MVHEYNLSLIFYPQQDGGYTVICPELEACFAEGRTIDEATANINNIIADFLPEQINASEADEELLREGLCMEGKIFKEVSHHRRVRRGTFPRGFSSRHRDIERDTPTKKRGGNFPHLFFVGVSRPMSRWRELKPRGKVPRRTRRW